MDEEYMVNDVDETAEDEFSEEDFDSEFLEEDESEESLESFTDEEEPIETEPEPEPKAKEEPGYVQRRIDKALARERDNIKAEIKAEMEAQYAPIRDRLLEMDAKELVRQGEFKSVERAKEYLQLKQGIAPAEEKPAEQPRNDRGQFAPKEDPATQAKIDMLAAQADKIKAKTGIDVIDIFANDEDIKNAVITGQMDFYDVAEQAKASRRRPPAPTRSPNGASGAEHNAISTMSDEQFERLEKRISEGARYKLS